MVEARVHEIHTSEAGISPLSAACYIETRIRRDR